MDNWRAKTPEDIKKFKKTIKNIIEGLDLDNIDEERLTKLKNEQNCLISFADYKKFSQNESKLNFTNTNNGFFRF